MEKEPKIIQVIPAPKGFVAVYDKADSLGRQIHEDLHFVGLFDDGTVMFLMHDGMSGTFYPVREDANFKMTMVED